MALAVDGLSSGLDTTALINSLMQLEAMPQALLKAKVGTTQSFITALQGLNSKIASLGALATTTAKPTALAIYSASSSATNLTAVTTAGAKAGELAVVVDQLARAQSTVTEAITAWPDTSLTITSADGAVISVSASSTSLDDMVTAVNAADAGVTAVKVAAGMDPGTGEALYRLQFTSTETGAQGAFTLSGTTVQMTEVAAAQDAEVRLWAGTTAEQKIVSSTDTFSDLLPGVSVTVSAVSPDPTTITVARDVAAAGLVAKNLVTSLNEVFALVSVGSVVTTTTSGGATSVRGGVFTGDSAVRSARQSLLSAASLPVDGLSPTEIGISITKAGVLEFDTAKFESELIKDPAKVESMLQEIATRVSAAASVASDKYDGTLTSKLAGQESVAKSLNGQILEWDSRLQDRRTALERTYAALEVRLGALNSQSSYLASQLASLPTGNSRS